jgi:mRNA-degrading endonuclease RelE of RelBE toxin-antitoxin system
LDIQQTRQFTKAVEKLHANQKRELDRAVEKIIEKPDIGVLKTGDLLGIYVYKFSMVNQLTLLAYSFDGDVLLLTLIAFGPHENFYRDLKKST